MLGFVEAVLGEVLRVVRVQDALELRAFRGYALVDVGLRRGEGVLRRGGVGEPVDEDDVASGRRERVARRLRVRGHCNGGRVDWRRGWGSFAGWDD